VNSENRILKIIWDKGSADHINLISREAGFGIDYTRYILNQLVKRGLVAQSSKNGLFKATSKGRKGLEALGVIEKKVRQKPILKKHTAAKKGKKAVRKKQRAIRRAQPTKKRITAVSFDADRGGGKVLLPTGSPEPPKVVLAHTGSVESLKVVLAHNLNSKEGEEKLNVWSAIKKAAKYLSAIPPDDTKTNV